MKALLTILTMILISTLSTIALADSNTIETDSFKIVPVKFDKELGGWQIKIVADEQDTNELQESTHGSFKIVPVKYDEKLGGWEIEIVDDNRTVAKN